MKKTITITTTILMLSGIFGACSATTSKLPTLPDMCKNLADAQCVYDKKKGKYIIEGDNSEIMLAIDNKKNSEMPMSGIVAESSFGTKRDEELKSVNIKIVKIKKQMRAVRYSRISKKMQDIQLKKLHNKLIQKYKIRKCLKSATSVQGLENCTLKIK